MAQVSGTIQPNFAFTQTPTSGILSGSPIQVPETLLISLANGTGADKIDLLFAKQLTFSASTSQTLDLTALTDILGAAVSFARVRVVAIKVYSQTDAASLTVGGAASNAWEAFLSTAGTITIPAASAANQNGAFFLLTAPNTTGWVVDSTHKNLKLQPSAHAFNADVFLAGCSA